MAEADPLPAFRRDLDPGDSLARMAAAAQERNLASLIAGQGPGGPVLADNAASTIRRKKHNRVGFGLTGKMSRGLVDAQAIRAHITADGGEVVILEPEANPVKFRTFVAGGPRYMGWVTEKTKSGKKKCYQVEKGQPPRPFVGVDERDLETTGEAMLEDVLDQWGFR